MRDALRRNWTDINIYIYIYIYIEREREREKEGLCRKEVCVHVFAVSVGTAKGVQKSNS